MKVKKLFRSSDCSDYSLEYNLNRLMELIVQEGWEIENVFQLTSYLGKIENYILASIEVENLEELESDNPKNLFKMGSFSRENRIGCKAESIDKIEHILKTQQDLLSFCTNRKCEDCDFNGEECKDKKFYNLGTISEKEVAYNYNLILFARKVVSGIPKKSRKVSDHCAVYSFDCSACRDNFPNTYKTCEEITQKKRDNGEFTMLCWCNAETDSELEAMYYSIKEDEYEQIKAERR